MLALCFSRFAYQWRLGLLALLLAVPSAQVVAASVLEEARALFRQGQPEQALQRLDATTFHSEDEVGASLLRGVLQAELGQMPAAIDTFERLSRDYPDLPQPLNNLAVIYAEQGMIEQARSTLLRTIELRPGHASAHHNLGDLYIRMALEAYARAYELDPENAMLTQKLVAIGSLAGGEVRPVATAPATASVAPPPMLAATPVAPKAKPKPVAAAPHPAFTDGAGQCLAVGPVQPDTNKAVRAWLQEQGIAATAVRREQPLGVIYQVYAAPLGDFAKTEARIAALKAKGVKVAVAIRTGVLRTGISLGAFKTEARARKLLRSLEKKGVEAQVRTQNPVRKETWLALSGAPRADRRAAITAQFPDLRVQIDACR